ncbi:MAG: hypothetical protein H6600_03040 [Flavobacteriales bacterium]|nr:hypothetical protein [Flavobacteriales bacterium]
MKYLYTLMLSFTFLLASAQNGDKTQSVVYYYTVENVTSADQLNAITSEFESLRFVTKVQLNYKSEKSDKAQFVVYVTEPVRSTEDQKMFELTDLKKIIINHNITPADLIIENL